MSFRAKIFSLMLLASAFVARAELAPGDAFPPLNAASLTGVVLPATDGRVVLVDFWASWCAPCKASFPAMAKLHADYASRGVLILAVGLDDRHDPRAAADAFIRRMAPPFVVLRDAGNRLVPLVAPPAMPTSYLLGRDGTVRFVHQGFHGEATEREVRRELDTLLAEKN